MEHPRSVALARSYGSPLLPVCLVSGCGCRLCVSLRVHLHVRLQVLLCLQVPLLYCCCLQSRFVPYHSLLPPKTTALLPLLLLHRCQPLLLLLPKKTALLQLLLLHCCYPQVL